MGLGERRRRRGAFSGFRIVWSFAWLDGWINGRVVYVYVYSVWKDFDNLVIWTWGGVVMF